MKSVTFENLKKQNYTMKESLRALKTNIQFCGDDICTIVVTSAMPNEGKSTVTMDLARSFSESGKRVLLIDTDMRKSVYVGRLRAVASGGVPANAAPAPCGGGIDCPRMYRLPRRLRDGQRRHPGQAGARAAGLRCCAGLQ